MMRLLEYLMTDIVILLFGLRLALYSATFLFEVKVFLLNKEEFLNKTNKQTNKNIQMQTYLSIWTAFLENSVKRQKQIKL